MSSADSKPAPSSPGASQPKRRRRRRRPPKQAPTPAAVLASSKPAEISKPADEPLTETEAASMRQHFRFLKEYRKVLRLRLNATEDLLINGAREPTHRGVCQHLLAKIDRARVIFAAQRLEAKDATRLMEGILRISPDLEYILLYLECVRRSASQSEATAALAQGLERIDFAKASHTQMRRVLDLIVELFDERHFPELLLGLLEGKTFRRAFDDSAASLPEPLAHLVVPLRSAQTAVLHGKSNPHDAAVLSDGVSLLLRASDETLLRYPGEVRRRLFEFGLQACEAGGHTSHRGLEVLYGSFPNTEGDRGELGLRLARHFLASDHQDEARKVLKSLAKDHPKWQPPGRWLQLLDAPRIGHIALTGRSKRDDEAAQRERRLPGVWLDSMRPVWVQVGSQAEAEEHAQTQRLLQELSLPSVAVWLFSGTTEEGHPYFVVPHPGQNLQPALERKGGLQLDTALQVCSEGVVILGALAAAGVRLPDARPRRFDLASNGRLWLVDLSGAKRQPSKGLSQSHSALARGFCQAVLSRARRYLPPPHLQQALEGSADCAKLSRLLEQLQSQ